MISYLLTGLALVLGVFSGFLALKLRQEIGRRKYVEKALQTLEDQLQVKVKELEIAYDKLEVKSKRIKKEQIESFFEALGIIVEE